MLGPVTIQSSTVTSGLGVATALFVHVDELQVSSTGLPSTGPSGLVPYAVAVAVPLVMSQSTAHCSPGPVLQKPTPWLAGASVLAGASGGAVAGWTFVAASLIAGGPVAAPATTASAAAIAITHKTAASGRALEWKGLMNTHGSPSFSRSSTLELPPQLLSTPALSFRRRRRTWLLAGRRLPPNLVPPGL